MANSRVSRGRRIQNLVAQYFRDHGWTGAESTPASLPGKDVTGMPSWAPEVKGTRDNPLPAALRQAAKNAGEGETPLVVWCPDGYGEARIDEWVVAFTFKDAVELMRKAEGWSVVDNAVQGEGPGINWNPERPYDPSGADRFNLLAGRVRALEVLILGDTRAEVS